MCSLILFLLFQSRLPLLSPALRTRLLNSNSNQTSDLASPSTSPLGAGYSVRGGASTPAGTPIRINLANRLVLLLKS